MGLDTSHNCWHGPYSAFSRFREAVALAAKEHTGYVPNYKGHPARAYLGWWDDDHPYDDVLDVFFVHSDCDGYIFPNHVEKLADALEPLVDLMEGRDRDDLLTFTTGLRAAADEWRPVEFH